MIELLGGDGLAVDQGHGSAGGGGRGGVRRGGGAAGQQNRQKRMQAQSNPPSRKRWQTPPADARWVASYSLDKIGSDCKLSPFRQRSCHESLDLRRHPRPDRPHRHRHRRQHRHRLRDGADAGAARAPTSCWPAATSRRPRRRAARILAEKPAGASRVAALDLSDLDSVAAFAEAFSPAHARLDLLINNAGVMVPPLGRTKQGFELQFGTNHLGHFALDRRASCRCSSVRRARGSWWCRAPLRTSGASTSTTSTGSAARYCRVAGLRPEQARQHAVRAGAAAAAGRRGLEGARHRRAPGLDGDRPAAHRRRRRASSIRSSR